MQNKSVFFSIHKKLSQFISKIFIVIAILFCLSYFLVISNASNNYLGLFTDKIEKSIIDKGINLVSNNSLSLIELAKSNAFKSLEEVIASTVYGDTDIICGFFIGSESTPWAYEVDMPLEDKYIFISNEEIHDLIVSKKLTFLELDLLERRFFVFSGPVMSNDDYLGTVVYIYSDEAIVKEKASIASFVNNALKTQLSAIIGFSCLLLLIAYIASKKFTSHITKPLVELTKSVEYMSSGDYEHAIDVSGDDEIGLLAKKFEDMRRTINNYTKNLESLVSARTEELYELNNRLEQMTITDPLTHVYNRRKFDDDFTQFFQEMKLDNSILALSLCDIDHFKRFNDVYGHQTGDDVIRMVGECIKSCVENSKLEGACYRYGGEEFCILCKDVYENEFFNLLVDIQQAIRSLKIEVENETVSVTASFGFCLPKSLESMSEEKLIELADKALYLAKENGRDRIESSADLVESKQQAEVA